MSTSNQIIPEKEGRQVEKMKNPWETLSQHELIGHSPEINHLRNYLPSIAKSEENVTVYGEAGTEKLLATKILFESSLRKDRPVLFSNANNLNNHYEDEVIEPLLAGQKKTDSPLNCTLIIENLEYLDDKAQQKLLILAQKRNLEIKNQTLATDVRIIATAHPTLITDLKNNKFNADLFLALTSVSLKLPPLRERRQDIPLLFEHYLKKQCLEFKKPIPIVDFEVFNHLMKHDWYGNVKELENTIRTMVFTSPDGELLIDSLPFEVENLIFSKVQIQDLNIAVSQLERELLQKSLRKFAGNQSKAAKALCLSEPNLRYKMKKLKINKKDYAFGH